jgi:hypothetical protein
MEPGREKHLATISSSTISAITEFDRCIRLIEAAPDLLEAVQDALATFDHIAFMQDARILKTRHQLKMLVQQINCSNKQK